MLRSLSRDRQILIGLSSVDHLLVSYTSNQWLCLLPLAMICSCITLLRREKPYPDAGGWNCENKFKAQFRIIFIICRLRGVYCSNKIVHHLFWYSWINSQEIILGVKPYLGP